jgi:hypothetical protein
LEASGKSTPFSATLFGELGQIYYHWHQLDQAQRYLQHSIEKSGQSGYSDPEIYKHVMLSRMFQMEGNWDASSQEMQKASDLARRIPPAMIREEIVPNRSVPILPLAVLSPGNFAGRVQLTENSGT